MNIPARSNNTDKWFALAIFSLGIGGAFAFLIGLSRAPFVSQFLPADYFRHALVGHVILAILFWLMLYAVVLWNYHFSTREIKFSFVIAATGTILVALSALTGAGEAVLNNYVPTIVHPLFFSGLGLFFVAFVINVFCNLKNGLDRLRSDDMMTHSLSVALFVALVMIVAMLLSLFLFGGDSETYQPQVFYERLFWTPGHIQQILNGAMLVAVWYSLAKTSQDKEIVSWKFLKGANLCLIVSALALLIFSFLWDPLDKIFRVSSEIVYGVGLGIPLFLHIINIVRQLKKHFANPAFSSLVISMTIYLFGILIAYGGFDDDTRVPAHYHGAVTALTLALMGFSYHMIKDKKLRIFFPGMARLQPYIYGTGMLLFISGLFVSGLFGAPRKTFGTAWTDNPVVLASLSLVGIGTLLAVIGGIIFVLYVSVTLIKGELTNGKH